MGPAWSCRSGSQPLRSAGGLPRRLITNLSRRDWGTRRSLRARAGRGARLFSFRQRSGQSAASVVPTARTVQVIPLQHTVPSELRPRVAEAIEGLGGEVAADERMNALLVVGDERVLAVAESVIGALDRESQR